MQPPGREPSTYQRNYFTLPEKMHATGGNCPLAVDCGCVPPLRASSCDSVAAVAPHECGAFEFHRVELPIGLGARTLAAAQTRAAQMESRRARSGAASKRPCPQPS